MKTYYRCLLPFAVVILALTVSRVKAAPYASGITNNGGNIQFYLNESGGSTTVTFDDGSTNDIFLDVYGGTNVTGTNMLSGYYSFPLGTHSSYAIAVTKFGTGTASLEPNAIQDTNFMGAATNHVIWGGGASRGVAVNVNPISQYFGRIYISRGGSSNGPPNYPSFYNFNADATYATVTANGTQSGNPNWSEEGHDVSPNRMSIASNDDVVVGDWSVASGGVYLLDPNLTTNELLLGPVGSIGNSVHGGVVSRPVIVGDVTSSFNLLQVDGTFNPTNNSTGPFNCILVYSNITLSAISSGSGWTTPPNEIGPEVAVNASESIGSGVYLYPSLCAGPNGYIYSGEYRSAPSSGNPAGVQVYNQNLQLIWQSIYTNSGTVKDYFYNAVSGGSSVLPTCVAVSPDGKYLCAVGYDGHFNICLLTNGVPDVSSLYTIKPDVFPATAQSFGLNHEVAWDAADNIYLLSASAAILGLKAWTLGFSGTCTTYGNATGSTNFSNVSLTPTISVYATNYTTISQINSYGNPTNTYFTIVRSGPLGATLQVNFSYSGTATNHTYVTGSASGVVLQPGQTSTNIPISAVTDGIDRKTIALTLTISSSMNYMIGAGSATISILNTATPELIPSVGLSSMYNAFSNDIVSVVITRLGDLGTTQTLTSADFTLTGTAAVGTDYTAPTPVTFNPGDVTQTTYMSPLNAGQVPTHNPNLTYTGNKTITVAIPAGSGYTGSGTATLNIIDSAYPTTAQVLYSNPLTNALDATNWNVTAADNNMSQVSPDVDEQFGYNIYTQPSLGYYNGYQFYPLPVPPNGASNALLVTVNKLGGTGLNGGPGTAVNLYMTNQVFSGNYAVRFNMNVIQGDCTPNEVGTFNPEEYALFGINHNGTQTNLFFPSFALGETETNFAADGVFYGVSDSGGRYDNIYQPYQGFIGHGSPATNTGWAFTATAATSAFATQFKTNIFSCYASANIAPLFNGGWTEGGPGLPVNGPQTTETAQSFSESSWADVEIKQIGNVDSLWIDKTRIMSYTNNTGLFTNGYVMLGYDDPYDGGETPDTAAYFSNLRVVALTPPAISGLAFNSPTNKFTFDFTSSDGDLTPSNFTVYGSTNLASAFASVSGASISQLVNSPGGIAEFQATVPITNAIHFYRIVQH